MGDCAKYEDFASHIHTHQCAFLKNGLSKTRQHTILSMLASVFPQPFQYLQNGPMNGIAMVACLEAMYLSKIVGCLLQRLN